KGLMMTMLASSPFCIPTPYTLQLCHSTDKLLLSKFYRLTLVVIQNPKTTMKNDNGTDTSVVDVAMVRSRTEVQIQVVMSNENENSFGGNSYSFSPNLSTMTAVAYIAENAPAAQQFFQLPRALLKNGSMIAIVEKQSVNVSNFFLL